MQLPHASLVLLLSILVISSLAQLPTVARNTVLRKLRDCGTSVDPEMQELLEGVYERADRWKKNGGGFNNPINRHAARQAQEEINATLPPINFSPSIDPDAIKIPPGAQTFKVGRTLPQTAGNPETIASIISEQGFRTFERIFNSNPPVWRGKPTYLEYLVYNDGADCTLMIMLYERLITIDGALFLQTPVHFECSVVALVAEAYGIPLINTCDYTMPFLLDSDPAYMNLKWTWDLTSNFWTAGDACVAPLHTAGAKSLISFEVPESPFYADQAIDSANALGMTVPFPKTVFSIADAKASYNEHDNPTKCNYFDEFIDKVIEADPDVVYGGALSETNQLLTCMFRRKYRPRGMVITVGQPVVTDPDFWKTVGLLNSNTWVNDGNYTDEFVRSPTYFANVFDAMWNTSERSLGYQASHGIGAGFGIHCIIERNSTAPEDIADCLTKLDIMTALGHIILVPGTRHYLRPYICQQILDLNNTIAIVYPPDYEFVTTPVFPWTMFYPKEFLDSLKNSRISRRDRTLIIVFSVFGLLLVVVAITAGIIMYKNHIILVSKSNAGSGNDNWDDESTQLGGVMGRAMACFRTDK